MFFYLDRVFLFNPLGNYTCFCFFFLKCVLLGEKGEKTMASSVEVANGFVFFVWQKEKMGEVSAEKCRSLKIKSQIPEENQIGHVDSFCMTLFGKKVCCFAFGC